ncbi:MAG TPA: NAD(P)-dependent alcohol dehydrogenase [Streptosporangiaceae bacterium]|nr:NAD(P)-dependent alcohol dehydrogenase [Streptosporangiaceae bacterium]
MRAVVYDRYGPPEVLRIEEVARPTPRDDEVVVQVRAATVNRFDCHTREANRSNGLVISGVSRLVSGIRRPRQPILGTEFAGEVAAAGPAVTRFGVGDRVFGNTGLRFGCHAEFTCVPETARVAPVPAGVGFAEAAAATDGALNALWCLRLAGPVQGRRVLVYGASGAIGTAAVQVAKHFGAQVTAVCGPAGVAVVQAIGADRVIDYTKEDFTADRGRYFSVFDAVGKESFAHCRGVIEPGGTYLATDGLRNLLLGPWTARFGNRKVRFKLPPRYTQQDVVLIKELMQAGSYRPVIDRVYPLEDVVEAARYVETKQKIGNVVLTVSDG